MTTQDVANKLVAYVRQGDWDKAQAELYAENAVSLEMPGNPFPERVEGLAAIKEKGELWAGMVEEMHGAEASDPVVAGNFFSLAMTMDVTMKGRPRSKDPEIALYKVEDGKIVQEQFFY